MTTLKLFDNISGKTDVLPKLGYGLFWLALFVASLGAGKNAYAAVSCTDTITANVVVLDNPTVFNRLGAQNPNWITYALRRDVVVASGPDAGTPLNQIADISGLAGNVELRRDKRPRPLVIRSVEGSCLTVTFTNLLAPVANPNNAQQARGVLGNQEPDPTPNTFAGLINNDQVAGRCAGFHATGTELVNGMEDDASMVGNNPGVDIDATDGSDGNGNCGIGLAGPGEERTYELYTPHRGAYIIHSYGATLGSESSSGNLGLGMFGALNVQPKGARLYRSQVTEEEMRLATVGTVPTDCVAGQVVGVDCNPGGQPIIDYDALYPNVEPWISEGKAGLPVLRMVTGADGRTGELVHSDINAIIAGPDADGSWRDVCDGSSSSPAANCPYPLESVGLTNPAYPNRLEPFREFTSIYHDEQTNSQVFPNWYNHPTMRHVLHGVKDQFMINYGSGGIGSEIISNRLRTGPMHDCTDCAYEEFFLASQTVGDPAMLVQFPANTGIEACNPENIAAGPAAPNACWRDANLANGPIPGNYALYQEDPSNVHHTYTGDFVKYRNTHAGAFEQHIFHFHNHQWLFNPNDDNANYLDAQEIMPGSGHTYEIANGGAGNRNHTTGDAIFHCHFYPHFAQGMWYHQRNHDVFEKGTVLHVSGGSPEAPGFHTNPFDLQNGRPMAGARALPDGELPDGSPIPAVVPLPGKPMPQMPAAGVKVMPVDRGAFSLLGGRQGPDGIPDSSQAVVDYGTVAGANGILGDADDVSPGYPFWLAGNECGPVVGAPNLEGVLQGDACPQGIVGQRMPTPPLDMLTDTGAAAQAGNDFDDAVDWTNLGGGHDGGLPRHALLGYTAGGLSLDTQNRLSFSKIIEMAKPVYFPEIGTELERVSMRYQAVRGRPSVANNLLNTGTVAGNFILNGSPPVPGGPYNDPCVDDQGDILRFTDGPGDWYDGDKDRWGTLNTKGVSQYDGENPRTYKIANLQIDAVFNKVGYHYPQERIIILWEDVAPTIAKIRPPEPLVMRFNTFDCGKLLHANLVPHEFELDDFQVRTPTDIIGQHIHLPKWDLTTNDGAANGWNYEDGALAPGIVEERIAAINKFNKFAGTIVGPDCTLAAALAGDTTACPIPGMLAPINLEDLNKVPTIDTGDPGTSTPAGTYELAAVPHPFFGEGIAGQHYTGARTVIQRLLVDPVVNVQGVDRGLGLTFSHDHYGPSTFQQIGLYSTILAEPAGSTWLHNESGVALNTRDDGGPTTWQAAIITPNAEVTGNTTQSHTIPDHREFYFEMSDFQHAYEKDLYVGADANGVPVLTPIVQPDPFNATVAFAPAIQDTWLQAVNPTLKLTANGGVNPGAFPDTVNAHDNCPGRLGQDDPNFPRPCPEAINIGHSSMWVVNYRNEPVGLRVFDPSAPGPDGRNGTQAAGPAGDLALAFQSRRDRAISQLNDRFGDMPYPAAPYCASAGDGINCDRNPGDPITPIMRAHENDHVKIKIQVGATEEQHQTTIHGFKWLSNGSGFGRAGNSGWRNFQSHGISEQFSLQVPINPDPQQRGNTVDYLYAQDATRDGIWSGTWGILRSYGTRQTDLVELPDTPIGDRRIDNQNNFDGVCPTVVLDQSGNPVDPPGRARNIPVVPKQFDVFAVLANEVLPNNLGVTIVENLGGDSDGDGLGDNVGGPLNPGGGTLVYNRRGTVTPSGAGPLNDPTAMMYVLKEDLAPRFIDGVSPDGTNGIGKNGIDDRCEEPTNGEANVNIGLAGCPVMIAEGAPVEPLVLRAEAGDCIDVTLHNKLLDQAMTAANSPVFYCDLNPDTGGCVAGSETPLFDAGQAADSLDQGQLLVDASGATVALAAIEFDRVPDLAGWLDTFWVVNRDLFKPVLDRNPRQMSFFGNNLIAPSANVGLHPQLVEYDASRADGLVIGGNADGDQMARPGGSTTYRWYAGDLRQEFRGNQGNRQRFALIPTPVEFGASNLLSADRVKQPQKGLFGALVIEPQGAVVTADTQVPDGQGTGGMTRLTRAQVDVRAPRGPAASGGNYRETLAIAHKLTNLRWADGRAIKNVNQAEFGVEGAEDSGHAGYNYGMEPSWFRFKLPPDADFGNAGTPNSFGSIPNPQAFYANALVAGEPNAIPAIAGVSAAGDPQTPVFRTKADTARTNPVLDTRMFLLNGASADRDGTYVLHGHVWQRDPHVCTGTPGSPQDTIGLEGRCDPWAAVPSNALGLNPLAKYMGGEEGMGHVFGHWPILFDAGGTGAVKGDYLFRDYAPNGNRNGMFGILRVE